MSHVSFNTTIDQLIINKKQISVELRRKRQKEYRARRLERLKQTPENLANEKAHRAAIARTRRLERLANETSEEAEIRRIRHAQQMRNMRNQRKIQEAITANVVQVDDLPQYDLKLESLSNLPINNCDNDELNEVLINMPDYYSKLCVLPDPLAAAIVTSRTELDAEPLEDIKLEFCPGPLSVLKPIKTYSKLPKTKVKKEPSLEIKEELQLIIKEELVEIKKEPECASNEKQQMFKV